MFSIRRLAGKEAYCEEEFPEPDSKQVEVLGDRKIFFIFAV